MFQGTLETIHRLCDQPILILTHRRNEMPDRSKSALLGLCEASWVALIILTVIVALLAVTPK